MLSRTRGDERAVLVLGGRRPRHRRAAVVDLVAGPTTGGIVSPSRPPPAGRRGFFAEEVRDADGATHRAFRRGFRIEPGERVLLVDDILTTGGSLAAIVPAVEAAGGEIVGCFVMADRSGGTAVLASSVTDRRYPVQGLWQLEIPTFEPGPDACPGCVDGIPLEAPGSTGTGGNAASAASAGTASA